MTDNYTKKKFGTVREVSKIYPCFSESSLRYHIFNSQHNGLKSCLRKLGKKILINIAEFEKWVDSHTEVTK